MLDGAAKPDDLMSEAARMGMPALAITDHGNLFGAYEFWKAGQRHGVNPVIGIEAYLTPGTSRLDKAKVRWGDGGREDVSGQGAYTHLTMWAETTAGMHNLFRMSSLASLEGFHRKPRMDRELLATYGGGVLATTGCPGGEVQTRLKLGQYGGRSPPPPTCGTSSGPATSTARSWTTGSTSNARSATTCCDWRRI